MSVFPASNTTNGFVREIAPISLFGPRGQFVKTIPSNEIPRSKLTGVKESPNSFNRDLNPIIKVLQLAGIIPITKTARGKTALRLIGMCNSRGTHEEPVME